MQIANRISRLPLLVQVLGGVMLVIIVSLGIFNQLMRPPINELLLMVLFLSITAIISFLLGYLAYRVGWINKSPTIRWSLLAGYALASFLTFLNVWITANLMFASQHDLLLATVLLLFAGGIATVLGLFLSSTITDRLRALDTAVQGIAKGKLETRVEIQGQDEIARLGESFNKMADQLQEADLQQRETERLRRDLIAWVSHDLQTPLATIRAIVEALADGVVQDEGTVQRYLATTQREIQALSVLIDDLFQMAQLDAGGLSLKREANSLTDLLSDTLESFTALAEKGQVEISGSVAKGIDPVYMDAQQIGRALNNLVSNGIRYTPPGGQVEVWVKRSGTDVTVEVLDNGEGIPDEDLPHIFDRFYRSEKSRSRATGGTGLGLAIARGIIEAHGGELGVESRPGQTRFYFTLPQDREPNDVF